MTPARTPHFARLRLRPGELLPEHIFQQVLEHVFEGLVQALAALLIAALTASGADWLLRSHPYLGRQNTLEYWLLPALTAGVISLPLFQLPLSLVWWVGFASAGLLLILVLLGEL